MRVQRARLVLKLIAYKIGTTAHNGVALVAGQTTSYSIERGRMPVKKKVRKQGAKDQEEER